MVRLLVSFILFSQYGNASTIRNQLQLSKLNSTDTLGYYYEPTSEVEGDKPWSADVSLGVTNSKIPANSSVTGLETIDQSQLVSSDFTRYLKNNFQVGGGLN